MNENNILNEGNEISVAAEKTETVSAKKNPNIYKLSAPFTYEGETYSEINLDFKKLTGNDVLRAEQELLIKEDRYIISHEIDTAFLINIAAKAAKINSDVLCALPANDFMAIRRRAQRFLNRRG
ncbi:MAG: phage tail assembly protein [Ruminococcus sp.]|nr:phage tail assembly protein [Ruminococcus sp.]